MEANSSSIFKHSFGKKAMKANTIKILIEKCAREAASLGASGHVDRDWFSCWGTLFVKAISENWCQTNDTNNDDDSVPHKISLKFDVFCNKNYSESVAQEFDVKIEPTAESKGL